MDRLGHYEILIRFNPENDQVMGAHYVKARVIIIDGEEPIVSLQSPEPIAADDSQRLGDLLGSACQAALHTYEVTNQSCIALQSQLDEATSQLGEKNAQISILQDQVASLELQLAQPDPELLNGVPQSVAMNKARKALAMNGLLVTVQNAVSHAPGEDGDLMRIDWEYSTRVRRDSPFVISMAGVLGFTNQQLDDLFIQASQLP